MICKKCGAQLPDNSQFCGHCGARFDTVTPVNAPVKKKSKAPVIIFLILAAIVGIALYNESHSKSNSRNNSYNNSSSYSKDNNGTLFSIDYVKRWYLDGYDDMTIGKAFDSAFSNAEWDFEKDGTKQCVEFYGEFKTDDGAEVGVLVDFVHNPLVHNESYFEIESVFMGDSVNATKNNIMLTSESDIRIFLDWVYKGEGFEWEWG